MENQTQRIINPYVSVDCVLLGFEEDSLKVLLVRQKDKRNNNMTEFFKLPGSLIYQDEELDEAAQRVLEELTGLKKIKMTQFHAFGSIDRMANSDDNIWLQRFHSIPHHIDRTVTIGYLSLLRINKSYKTLNNEYDACWMDINSIPKLAFDHNSIVEFAVKRVQELVQVMPQKIFELLPRKFTEFQLRTVFEIILNKKIDNRNFHKKFKSMRYVIPLDEKETNVAHRAARYYKFDKNNL